MQAWERALPHGCAGRPGHTRASRERVCPSPFSGLICPSRFQNAARCDGRCSAVRFLFRSAAFSSTMCTGSRVRTRQSVFFEDVWGAPHQYNAHGLSGSTPAIPRNDNPPSRFPPYNAYGLPFARLCRWRGIRACFVPGRTPNALSSKTPCVLKNAILPKTPCPQKALPPKTPCLQKALPPKTPCLQNTMPPKTPCHQKHHAFKTPCHPKHHATKNTMPSKHHATKNAVPSKTPCHQKRCAPKNAVPPPKTPGPQKHHATKNTMPSKHHVPKNAVPPKTPCLQREAPT